MSQNGCRAGRSAKQASNALHFSLCCGEWAHLQHTQASVVQYSRSSLYGLSLAHHIDFGTSQQGSGPSIHIVSLTEVVQSKLQAEDKRQRMTKRDVKDYNTALLSSRIARPDGPARIIDVHSITKGRSLGHLS